MAQQLSPWLEGAYGWNFGESNWNTGIDSNQLKFSFMFDRNVDGIVSSLPAAVNGQAYFLTTDNRLYFAVGTTWFSTPTPKWFEFTVKSSGNTYQFNGTSANQIDSPTQIDTRLDSIELTVASLGTAAFEDIEFFATQSALDVVEANSQAYTDTLRQDIADQSDVNKGASLVGYRGRTVSGTLDAQRLNSVVELVGRVATSNAEVCKTLSYWPVWENILSGPVGGAEFVWDKSRPKSQHNAGNIVSPTVPWDGAQGTFAAYIAGTGETDPSGVGCWVHKDITGNQFNVLQWGAKNDATTNGENNAMIQPLLNYVEASVGGGRGGVVYFPRGNYGFGVSFNVRDRTTLRGEGTESSILHFASLTSGNAIILGPTGPNHPLNPNGHHVFATRLESLSIAGGNNYKGVEKALVYTDGAHEHSGLFNVVLRDFVSYGVHYNTGNGGPAFFEISGVEIYGSDTAPSQGTKRGIICNAGGTIIMVNHATITGGATNKLANGIFLTKDNLLAQGVHFENCNAGISLAQTDATNPRTNFISGVTGNLSVSPNGLVDIASSFEGAVSVHGIINKSLSGTGLITLINRRTGESFLDQAVAAYMYPRAISPGESVSHGRINVSGGVASVVKAVGVSFTVSQTATGTTQVTLASAMPDTNYTVIPVARPSGGGAMFCEFSPSSTTVFNLLTRNQAGTLTDPSSVWFSLEI